MVTPVPKQPTISFTIRALKKIKKMLINNVDTVTQRHEASIKEQKLRKKLHPATILHTSWMPRGGSGGTLFWYING